MKTFNELRKISVLEKMKKKGKFNYLSWAYAVDVLLQEDENANWEFLPYQMFGETMMVFCTVIAFGRQRTAFLPVMNGTNQAITNPDASQVNKAMQRCLVKAIALHGIALYIYEGEDLPDENEAEPVDISPIIAFIAEAHNLEDLRIKYVGAVKSVNNDKEALKQLEAIKDKRKAELMAQEAA